MSDPCFLHRAARPEQLLDQHRKRVDLIRQCANEMTAAEFERKWLAVLERCADWFSSMPLSADLYREPGGAFRCTVETAFYAMRLAGGQKFGTNLPSEKRRRIEPQYNYGVFLAAVCSRLDEPFRYFTVERGSDHAQWNPSVHGAAGPWIGEQSYSVMRRTAELPVERMRTGMLAQMLVGSELLGGLDAEVLSEVFGAINPNMKPLEAETLTHKVVRQAVDAATEFERKAQRAVIAPAVTPIPAADQLAAAIAPLAPAPTPSTPATAPMASASVTPPTSAEPAAQAGPSTAGPKVENTAAPVPAAAQVQKDPAGADGRTVPGNSAESKSTAAPRSLLEAIGLADPQPAIHEQRASRPDGADQLGLPLFGAAAEHETVAVNPADMRTAGSVARVGVPVAFEEVLKGAPNMILDLFRALREDVAAGKAKVEWNEKGLAVQKRLIGNYGIASDTLVDHLRKRSLLLANGQGEVVLAPRAGDLISPRPEGAT